MYRGSVIRFVDLSVTTGAASCHVQRVRFWHLKSADFLETWWGVKISDICGEMNPLVFSALKEVNLVFILMMSSTVMVDIVFARFIGDDETQQRYTFRLL